MIVIFLWPLVNKDNRESVRNCIYCGMSNMTSNESHMQLDTFETYGPFDSVFLYVWDICYLPDGTGSSKIITCLCWTTRFLAATEKMTKYPTSEQVSIWYFRELFVPYGLTKIIIVDMNWLFSGVTKSVFSEFM